MSLHSLLTVLLLIPASPMACTRSSTRRVETPPIPAKPAGFAPGLLDDGHQGFLRRLARLQERREVAALPQLGDPELQAAQARVERTLPIAVAVGLPLGAALMTPSADQPVHVRLHQELHNGLGHAAQEVAISGFGQKLGQG